MTCPICDPPTEKAPYPACQEKPGTPCCFIHFDEALLHLLDDVGETARSRQ